MECRVFFIEGEVMSTIFLKAERLFGSGNGPPKTNANRVSPFSKTTPHEGEIVEFGDDGCSFREDDRCRHPARTREISPSESSVGGLKTDTRKRGGHEGAD